MLTAFARQKRNARKCLSAFCMRTWPVMLYVYHAACAASHMLPKTASSAVVEPEKNLPVMFRGVSHTNCVLMGIN
jgi:hypothetical protein